MRNWVATVILVLTGTVAQAQVSQDATITGIRRPGADSLLPVLDDYGQPIPEDLIRATMRSASTGHKVRMRLGGAVLGALAFALIHPRPKDGADCSIYQPCTDQEKFYKDFTWLLGAGVGFTVGWGLETDDVTRWQAVEILRARRREAHSQ